MADSSLRVHVTVVDWSDESNFRSLEGIVSRELCVEQEQPILVGSLFGAKHKDLPEVDVGAWEDSHKRMRVFAVALNFLSYSPQTGISLDFFRLF